MANRTGDVNRGQLSVIQTVMILFRMLVFIASCLVVFLLVPDEHRILGYMFCVTPVIGFFLIKPFLLPHKMLRNIDIVIKTGALVQLYLLGMYMVYQLWYQQNVEVNRYLPFIISVLGLVYGYCRIVALQRNWSNFLGKLNSALHSSYYLVVIMAVLLLIDLQMMPLRHLLWIATAMISLIVFQEVSKCRLLYSIARKNLQKAQEKGSSTVVVVGYTAKEAAVSSRTRGNQIMERFFMNIDYAFSLMCTTMIYYLWITFF